MAARPIGQRTSPASASSPGRERRWLRLRARLTDRSARREPPDLLITALVALLLLASAAQAKPRATSVRTPQGTITTTRMPGTGGARKLLFKYGPVRIHPGQNTISITPTSLAIERKLADRKASCGGGCGCGPTNVTVQIKT